MWTLHLRAESQPGAPGRPMLWSEAMWTALPCQVKEKRACLLRYAYHGDSRSPFGLSLVWVWVCFRFCSALFPCGGLEHYQRSVDCWGARLDETAVLLVEGQRRLLSTYGVAVIRIQERDDS